MGFARRLRISTSLYTLFGLFALLLSGQALEDAKPYAKDSPEVAELVRASQKRVDQRRRVLRSVFLGALVLLMVWSVALSG